MDDTVVCDREGVVTAPSGYEDGPVGDSLKLGVMSRSQGVRGTRGDGWAGESLSGRRLLGPRGIGGYGVRLTLT